MTENPQTSPVDAGPVDAGTVKYLRVLVSVLSITMIAGFLVIVGLFVIRFSTTPRPDLPDVITLPEGSTPQAYTRGSDWYAIVTEENQILIFDLNSGTLRQTIDVK